MRADVAARGVLFAAVRLGCMVTAVVGVFACRTPSIDAPGPAYDPTIATGGRIYHWPLGTSIAVYVAPGPITDGATLDSATRIALDRWSNALGYREHDFQLTTDPSRADIVVRDVRTDAPVETDCGGAGWTHAETSTFFCPDGDTVRTLPLRSGGPGRVKVLITVQVEPSIIMVVPDRVLTLVVHEIGHALGIGGHSSVDSDVMFGIPEVSIPSRRDVRTLRYLLHRRPDLTL